VEFTADFGLDRRGGSEDFKLPQILQSKSDSDHLELPLCITLNNKLIANAHGEGK
jgi:hypothetical protein